jgi:hypothetical protein
VLGVAVDEAHMSLIKIFANEYILGRHNCGKAMVRVR